MCENFVCAKIKERKNRRPNNSSEMEYALCIWSKKRRKKKRRTELINSTHKEQGKLVVPNSREVEQKK